MGNHFPERFTRPGKERRCHRCSALLPTKDLAAYRGSRPFCKTCVDLCRTPGCNAKRSNAYRIHGLCRECGIAESRARAGKKLCACGKELVRGESNRSMCPECAEKKARRGNNERTKIRTIAKRNAKPCKVCGRVGVLLWKKRYCRACARSEQVKRNRRVAKYNKARRRAALAGVRFEFSEQAWRELLEAFGHRCAYCGRGDVPMTKDHARPIVRGGDHTKENIVPACRRCNVRKHTKMPLNFLWQLAAQGGAN